MISSRLKLWLTGLYPREWRARYGDEFDALLSESLHTPLDVLDVFLGALDARLQLFNDANTDWRNMNRMNKLRTTILIVFTAFIGFVIAGFALVGIADDSPMIPLMSTNLTLFLSWHAVQAAALIALLAIVIGGAPLTLTLLRQAIKVNRRILHLLFVPVVSLVVLIAYVGFVALVTTGHIHLAGVATVVQPGMPFPPVNRLLLATAMGIFVLGAAASTWAVWKAVTAVDTSPASSDASNSSPTAANYRFAYIPAVVASFSMGIIFLATIIWGWVSFSVFPQVYTGDFGPWLTSTRAWYFSILALMLISTLAALLAVNRGRKVLRQS